MWKIASEYNTTVDTLMDVNNLKGTKLTINQQLLIPKSDNIDIDVKGEGKGIEYVVKPGDSLSKIASSYGITVERIKSVNNLNGNTIYVGQKLLIPVYDTKVEEKEDDTSTGINYVVVKGDNLYSIANKYNVSVDDIKSLNKLSSNTLNIGQVLKIPGTESFATYKVKKGDSLWKIANKYGVSVTELKNINNLSGSNLAIGQEILIPTK